MINNGTRVRFSDDSYGVIIGHLPRTQRGAPIVYRIGVEGYQGGRHPMTATADKFEAVGTGGSSGNTERAKPRPYGVKA